MAALCSLLLSGVLGRARAVDRQVQATIGVGATEVLYFEGGHGGYYPAMGGGLVIPIGPYASIIPFLAIEWAPENGHWGLVASATFDQPLAEWIGIDITLQVGEDHVGAFAEFEAFVGIGLGPAFYIGRGVLAFSLTWIPGPHGGALAPGGGVTYLF